MRHASWSCFIDLVFGVLGVALLGYHYQKWLKEYYKVNLAFYYAVDVRKKKAQQVFDV